MSLTEYDRAIWSAMGLGPVWIARQSASSATQANTVRDAVAWVGQYETRADENGVQWPSGTAGQLLLNMLEAAGIDPDSQVFVGVQPSHVATDAGAVSAAFTAQIRQALQDSACAKAVLMGAAVAGVLQVADAAGKRPTHEPVVLTLDTHAVSCLPMEGLAELLSEPRRKAVAWADVCRIRECYIDKP